MKFTTRDLSLIFFIFITPCLIKAEDFEGNSIAPGYAPSGQSIRLLEFYKTMENSRCNPETNVYPCGALQFMGCAGNKKYWVQSTIRLNWFEAWEFCRANNMYLASVLSKYEQNFLEIFLPKPEVGATEGYWIGGVDLGREGQFVWMNSGHSISWSNWLPGEPNNYGGGDHCVQVQSPKSAKGPMKWIDAPCTWVAYSICQEEYVRQKS